MSWGSKRLSRAGSEYGGVSGSTMKMQPFVSLLLVQIHHHLVRGVPAELVVDHQAKILDVEVLVVIERHGPAVPGVVDPVGRAFRPHMRVLQTGIGDGDGPLEQGGAQQLAIAVEHRQQVVVVEDHDHAVGVVGRGAVADDLSAGIHAAVARRQEAFAAALDHVELQPLHAHPHDAPSAGGEVDQLLQVVAVVHVDLGAVGEIAAHERLVDPALRVGFSRRRIDVGRQECGLFGRRVGRRSRHAADRGRPAPDFL